MCDLVGLQATRIIYKNIHSFLMAMDLWRGRLLGVVQAIYTSQSPSA